MIIGLEEIDVTQSEPTMPIRYDKITHFPCCFRFLVNFSRKTLKSGKCVSLFFTLQIIQNQSKQTRTILSGHVHLCE